MAKRTFRKPGPSRPYTTEAGADLIRDHALKLFDRQDGEGANWPLMASSLFRVAFDALDLLLDNACRKMAGRVHAGAYGCVTEGPRTAASAGTDGGRAAERAVKRK